MITNTFNSANQEATSNGSDDRLEADFEGYKYDREIAARDAEPCLLAPSRVRTGLISK